MSVLTVISLRLDCSHRQWALVAFLNVKLQELREQRQLQSRKKNPKTKPDKPHERSCNFMFLNSDIIAPWKSFGILLQITQRLKENTIKHVKAFKEIPVTLASEMLQY